MMDFSWGTHKSVNYFDSVIEQSEAHNMHEMLYDALGMSSMSGGSDDIEDEVREGPSEETLKFYKLMKENETKLYPDCKKFTKLSFIIRLFTIKCWWVEQQVVYHAA